MLVPNRNFPNNTTNNGGYRYGFQGQELDDEIKNSKGTSLNYKFRMHDPRVGRFFAVDPLASKYPHNSTYAFSENVVINAVELEGLEKAIIVNNNIKGYKASKIKVATGEKIKEAGYFYKFSVLMKDIGLLNDDKNIHFKVTGVNQDFNGSDVQFVVNYRATWLFGDETVKMDFGMPFASVHILGSKPIDYPLVLIGSGFYGNLLKSGLRPLYTESASQIRTMAQSMVKNGSWTESIAAKFANKARNKLKTVFLKSTPKDLREVIFKFNKKRGLNKWGTKAYEELIKKGKTNAQIIESSGRPLGDKMRLGEALYKSLGEEVVPVLKKYKIMPKK